MPFKPGQSGNPGGRAKKNQEITELARAHGPAAISRLFELMSQTDDGKLAKAAADSLLDRGFGRPVQQIEQKMDIFANRPEELSDEALAAVVAGNVTDDG